MKRSTGVVYAIVLAAVVLTLSGCERLLDFFGSFKLSAISIEPQTIEVGENIDLVVMGVYDDGSEEEIVTDLTWATNAPEVATVTAGTVTGLSAGEAIILVMHAARRGDFTDTAVITVIPAQVVVDDFETDNLTDWAAMYDEANSASLSFSRSTTSAHGGAYSLETVYDFGGAGSWGCGALYEFPDGPADLSELTGVSVWINPNGTVGSLVVTVEDSDGTQLTSAVNPGAVDFSGTAWVEVAHDFDDMVASYFPGTTAGMDFTSVKYVQFTFGSGAGTVYMDDYVIFY